MAKIHFNVDAYTAKLIGRENVSKLDGAILELVKNTYDADASVCFLYFEKETETLYIGDNGTGMSQNIIEKHWMTIGSSSKKLQYKTDKGRIQTGAKGIGRFALDRIADHCELLTISEHESLRWEVDWTIFEFGQNITDVAAELEATTCSFEDFIDTVSNRNLIKFINGHFSKTGSIFKLTKLRDLWNEKSVEGICENLKTLIPPEFKEVFNIYLFKENSTIEDAALLQDGDGFSYDYKIKFKATVDGNVTIEINRDEFDFRNNFVKVIENAGFKENDERYFQKTPIVINTNFQEFMRRKEAIKNSIGDFEGILYFVKLRVSPSDREKYYYKDITGRPDIRDTFGGIRIYRDSFRVRPYGDPKTSTMDWLMLAARKNKSPAAISHTTGSWRVNSDQIHGSIYISRENTTLEDQANRQGIVETKEFMLLQNFIKYVITEFERDRQSVCRKLNTLYQKEHPHDIFEKNFQKEIAKLEEAKSKHESLSPHLKEVEQVSALIQKKNTEIRQLETELQMLRVLATTGIVTNTYIHEIKATDHKLGMKINSAKDALKLDADLKNGLKYVLEAIEIRKLFTSWFKVTIESVRRDKRQMKKINLGVFLNTLLSDWRTVLSSKTKIVQIKCDIEDVSFKCFPYEIESIINNLIANSVSSFNASSVQNEEINIMVKSCENGISIAYSDRGKGLSPTYKKDPQKILNPFESDKTDIEGDIIGTGMGMWIINRIVSDYNGTIDLTENKTCDVGFHITIMLKEKE